MYSFLFCRKIFCAKKGKLLENNFKLCNHPIGRVILVHFKKCLFQFPLNMIFFREHFWFFFNVIFRVLTRGGGVAKP